MEALSRLILPIALMVTPLLLTFLFAGRARPTLVLALIGPSAIALNLLVPLGLHLAGIAIVRATLAAAHMGLLLLALGAAVALASRAFSDPGTRVQFRSIRQRLASAGRPMGPLLLLYAMLVIPFTHIAGIDTYKWQDLATGVAVEGTIPWLVHPASLFGFTPRAYPSAQPLVLASIQILGGTGVDWGFYLISLLTGFTAITGAYVLGQRLYDDPDRAWWLALLYGFSPLLMRYGYWATGRGFLLALLPLFVLLLLDVPRVKALLTAVSMGVLLALSHKAGLVAALLIPAAFALSSLVARCRIPRAAAGILMLTAAMAGLALTPGLPAWGFRAVSRLAWIFPLALVGVLAESCSDTRERRAVFVAALLLMPLAFADDPYGALLAVPLVTGVAASGAAWLSHRAAIQPFRLRVGLMTLVILAACIVIGRQAMDSPSRSVVKAARFLDAYDPLGPFRIEAPGRARTRMQAYVSGCPRFQVSAMRDARLTVTAPPPLTGRLHSDLGAWTRWLRAWVDVPEIETAWYGVSPRVYYVRIDNDGAVPPDARLLYDRDGVAIFTAP